jgi:glucosylceramidase
MEGIMKLHKIYAIASLLFLLSAVPLFSQTAYVRTTIKSGNSAPYCIPWVDSGAKAGTAWATTNGYIEILPNTQYQTVQGFGGCFQEKMWDALSHCSTAGRDSVIRALFDTSGCNFTVMRMPIGANDFSDSYYSLDDVAGDNSMTSFSLHRDSTKLIPLIKWAQDVKPDLRFWASPWTPPSWMKQNNNYYTNTTAAQNHIKTDATTMTAYALYLSKAVQEFKKAGITIEYITCQNEPDQDNHNYPTCGWTFAEEMTFYKTYMFPRFTQDNLTTKLILGVYCCTSFADGIQYFMNDGTVAAHVGVTSHSFEDNTVGPQCYSAYPSIPFYETESNYGVLSATTQVQDWAAGVAIFNTEAAFMATGRASVYNDHC